MPKQVAETPTPKQQDVLTHKPVPVKIVRDVKTAKTLRDPLYFPIIKALRKGPMTVRELEEAYKIFATDSGTQEPKSDKTIYRYLKVLQDADLVVPAGQRVVIGKTATETLFERSARAFLVQAEETKPADKEKGRRMVQRISKLLGRVYGNREPDLESCEKFFNKVEKEAKALAEQLLGSADEETLEIATAGNWEEIDEVLNMVTIFGLLLKRPELLDELNHCFVKGKPVAGSPKA
jgi:hypothetical protein